MICLFIRVLDCFSEHEFRSVVKQLYNWMESSLQPDANLETRLHLITACCFLNQLYDSYNVIAVPHFGKIIELLPEVLIRCNARKTEAPSLLFVGNKETAAALEANLLITLTIDFVTKCAKHPEFFTEDRANLLLDPLIDELEDSSCWGHEGRCVPHLADCLFQIANANNGMLADINTRILLKSRSQSAKIRCRVLMVIERMYERMGEAVVPLLPCSLPFLSELIEDDNKKVEQQCDKVIALLKRKFGEEIAQGLI
ncbi:hypothetical protein AB6A40_000429 [Gnathostoma spinigerum]|uniref:HEAT repeat-containing protein 1 n=1 Tax=Gnathostoma spinigerum TaxID=75299 RepID=A0ABD6E310_9BILA